MDYIYDRFDPSKNYTATIFRADTALQSAELNEIQHYAQQQAQSIGDAIFKDGDIRSGGQAIVDGVTGAVSMTEGLVYLRGSVRPVPARSFTIPVDQVVKIGVRLVVDQVTPEMDESLHDPAVGTPNQGEPGAWRRRETPTWGWSGDGRPGDLFETHTVENGLLLQKELPPQFDGVTQAIRVYDKDSSGGSYVVSGLNVSASYNAGTAKVTILVGEGKARVDGYGAPVPRSVRMLLDADINLQSIVAEPKTFTPDGNGQMRVNVDNAPLVAVDQVRITKQVLEVVRHGDFTGAQDVLANNSVLSIVGVNQGGTWTGSAWTGGTTYVQGTDYKLTAGKVDWSLSGGEVSPGSSYNVVYQYQTATGATITGIDSTGFTIAGPVAASLFTVDYKFALPRIDAIVIDSESRISRLVGVASQYNPAGPSVPDTMLKLASIVHNWSGDPTVVLDAVTVIPMADLRGLQAMVYDLFEAVAQNNLKTEIGLADPAAKRGIFVDPFNNDNLRDAGIAQTASIVGGMLVSAITASVARIATAITTPQLLPYTLETVIDQSTRTKSMPINPYLAFSPAPAQMQLDPAVDFWTQTNTTWSSEITQRLTTGGGVLWMQTVSTAEQLVASTTKPAEYLRPIVVKFTLSGFDAGENLASLTFDGIAVTAEAL